MLNILERLVDLEAEVQYRLPPPPGQQEYRYTPGNIPVLLSAPHGAVHTRQGLLKDEDEYTAAFARLIAETTGAHVLYACRKSETDPNWYAGVPYKNTLRKIIETHHIGFVLDLHGAAARRGFGLAFGSMGGESCPQQRGKILELLESSGFASHLPGWERLDIDHTFKGSGGEQHETITRYTWRSLGVPAAQLEINAHLRIVQRKADASLPLPFRGDPRSIEKTVSTFINLVKVLTD